MDETDEIVITGISGRLPESENVDEFRQHLFNMDDMVTEDDRRWEPGTYVLYFKVFISFHVRGSLAAWALGPYLIFLGLLCFILDVGT